MRLINNKFEDVPISRIGDIDLIIADPPDNIGLKYDGFDDSNPVSEYITNLETWLSRMSNITNGPIFFTFNEKWTKEVETIIDKLEIPLIQRIQWYYTFGQDQTSNSRYGLCYRPIYWLNSSFCNPEKIKVPSARQAKYNDKRAKTGGKMPPNVWEFSRICGTFKERRKWVPTQLPLKLVERIALGHCREGGCVLDPFLGTGTTAIICKELNLDFVGMEFSKDIIEKTSEYLGVQYE